MDLARFRSSGPLLVGSAAVLAVLAVHAELVVMGTIVAGALVWMA